MYLVLIQTSGNQSYVFGTNKLKENIGASQLTYECGTEYVLSAIDTITARDQPVAINKPLWNVDDVLRRNALLAQGDISGRNNPGAYEVVYATSGNALVLTIDQHHARELIAAVTKTAALKAPGLDGLGCMRKIDWPSSDVGSEIRAIYEDFEKLRGWRGGPRQRAQALPVVARCVRSGLPAGGILDAEDLSMESLVKSEASTRWTDRQRRLFKDFKFPDNLDDLEAALRKEERWIGVAHGDGNGLGKVLQEFAANVPACPPGMEPCRHYVTCLRRFSIALERQSEAAFREAATTLIASSQSQVTPVIPLVLAGDDLTVICEGFKALVFARRYLSAFERLTQGLDGLNPDRLPFLTGCVGVALIKPHFPFHAAYDLAEELLKSAKKVKEHRDGRDHSAIDFHVLYDSSFVSVGTIREKLVTGDAEHASLTAKPYVTSDVNGASNAWLRAHHVDGLSDLVQTLRLRTDEGEQRLSRTQLHELRAALFEGDAALRRQLRLGERRYDREVIQRLEDGRGFFHETADDNKKRECRLLDAMEVADGFWPEG